MNKMHPLISKIKAYVEQYDLLLKNSRVIIGLSGGPDSVFLLHVLHALKSCYDLDLHAVHIDHEWRPESSQEALFCDKLCKSLGINYTSFTLSGIADKYGFTCRGSKEAYARHIRQKAFELAAKKYSANIVALGHHADDQVENFFIRLIRGASVAGLASMDPKIVINRKLLYIRPLLFCKKKDILAFLVEHKYSFLQDPSNHSDVYLRNRVRNKMIPLLDSIDSRASKNIGKAIERLQETENFLQTETENCWRKVAEKKENVWFVHKALWQEQSKFMKKRLLMHWLIQESVPCVPTEKFFEEIIRFLANTKSIRHVMGKSWQVCKKKSLIFIAKIRD